MYRLVGSRTSTEAPDIFLGSSGSSHALQDSSDAIRTVRLHSTHRAICFLALAVDWIAHDYGPRTAARRKLGAFCKASGRYRRRTADEYHLHRPRIAGGGIRVWAGWTPAELENGTARC